MNKLNQNLTVGCQTGSRFVRFIIAVMLVVPLMLGMSSCSSDDKDKVDEPVIDNASELYGIWEALGTTQSNSNGVNVTTNWETIIIFNSESKFLTENHNNSAVEGGSVKTIEMNYNGNYRVIDKSTIELNNGYLSYKIVGNNLILEYISGTHPSILHGENKIVYTNKSKVDIVEYPYGTWRAIVSTENIKREFSLGFYMDNELSFSEKKQDTSYFTGLENYKYLFSGNKIELYKEGNSSAKPDCTLSYKVVGNNITFEYISGEKPLFISVFNADKATYTGNN